MTYSGRVRDGFARIVPALPSLQGTPISLADGTFRLRPYHELMLVSDDGARRTEVLQIEGNPLLGVGFLSENLLQAEMTDGGEVLVEPL